MIHVPLCPIAPFPYAQLSICMCVHLEHGSFVYLTFKRSCLKHIFYTSMTMPSTVCDVNVTRTTRLMITRHSLYMSTLFAKTHSDLQQIKCSRMVSWMLCCHIQYPDYVQMRNDATSSSKSIMQY